MIMNKCPKCGSSLLYGVKECNICESALQGNQGHDIKELRNTAKIIINRERKTIGSIQNHNIYLNGNCVGVLKNGGTLEIPVDYGTHIIEFNSSMKKLGENKKITVCVSKENPAVNISSKFEMNGNFEIIGANQTSNGANNSRIVDDIKYTIKGLNGQLYVYENKIEITRKGVWAFAHQGLKGTKTIPISEIKSIQLKRAGLVQGYIQFGISGSIEGQGGYQAANYDENTVTFLDESCNKIALNIKSYIEDIIANKSNSQNTIIQQSYSDADELMKFKKLLDDGVITQEEFDAKKKQILGL